MLMFDCHLLVVICLLLRVGCLVVGCWLLFSFVVCGWLLASGLLVVRCSLLVRCCSLLIVGCCEVFGVRCSLFDVRCLFVVVCC